MIQNMNHILKNITLTFNNLKYFVIMKKHRDNST